jgi:hypothetical protein
MPKLEPDVNVEGLTFPEWIAAAGLPIRELTLDAAAELARAWQEGDDPTEWRAEQQHHGRTEAALERRTERAASSSSTDPAVKSARAYNAGFLGQPLPAECSAFRRMYDLGRADGASEQRPGRR